MPTADQISELDILETDPIDWELDADWELIFPLRYTRGSPAIGQRLGIKLKMFMGELFLDRLAGTPYLENDVVGAADAILGETFNRVRAEAQFRVLILSVIGVARIVSMSLTFTSGDSRTLDVVAEVVTVYGHTITVAVSQEFS